MSKPDFIGVGTERAGTSWVFSMIAHHPDIWVPPIKELHFLDSIDADVPSHNPRYKWHITSRLKQKLAPLLKWEHRPEFYKNSFFKYLLWDLFYFTGKKNFKWYQRLFSSTFTKGRMAGEYTPAYCNVSDSYIEELITINPNMKFLLVIRHPREQLRSSLIQHFVMIKGRDFNSVTEQEMLDWVQSPFAQKKGNIKEILMKWNCLVSEDHLFIGLYEEMKEQPLGFIKRVYQFLGLSLLNIPEENIYNKKINNLTKPTYQIPESVQQYIDQKFEEDISYFKNNYPDLAKYWSKNGT